MLLKSPKDHLLFMYLQLQKRPVGAMSSTIDDASKTSLTPVGLRRDGRTWSELLLCASREIMALNGENRC